MIDGVDVVESSLEISIMDFLHKEWFTDACDNAKRTSKYLGRYSDPSVIPAILNNAFSGFSNESLTSCLEEFLGDTSEKERDLIIKSITNHPKVRPFLVFSDSLNFCISDLYYETFDTIGQLMIKLANNLRNVFIRFNYALQDENDLSEQDKAITSDLLFGLFWAFVETLLVNVSQSSQTHKHLNSLLLQLES